MREILLYPGLVTEVSLVSSPSNTFVWLWVAIRRGKIFRMYLTEDIEFIASGVAV